MLDVTATTRAALQYVRNTNGGAGRAHFLDDHEPVGETLWQILDQAGWIELRPVGHGMPRVFLTPAGNAALDGP